jgi:membrane fusion protein
MCVDEVRRTLNMFRKEASEQFVLAQGGPVMSPPLSWRVVSYMLFGTVTVAGAFLVMGSYARTETVSGTLVPSQGVASIVPSRQGVVLKLGVQEGEEVQQGQHLTEIRVEEGDALGISPQARVEDALGLQNAQINAQIASTNTSFTAQRSQIAAQSDGLRAEMAQLRSQIVFQQELVAFSSKELERIHAIADKGFISGRDIQQREETLTTRQQALSQLQQALGAKESQLLALRHQDTQLAAQAKAQAESLAASRSQVVQQLANTSAARSYVVLAPITGKVSALSARVGQSVNPQSTLMTIVPAHAVLNAELAVPTSAIGFVKPGQEVRLAIDAFPYQRFGTVKGQVQTVASSAIAKQGANGTTVSVYLVTVLLETPFLIAYGRKEMLIAGMTLSARIVTERMSLLEWLFEPLYAVQRRLV